MDYTLVGSNLKKHFVQARSVFGKPTKFLRALDGVDIKLKPGEIIGIVGESGCGKSTLSKTLVRIYEPDQGDIIILGKRWSALSRNELRSERKNIQMIFQDPYSSLNPRMSVFKIIEEPCLIHGIPFSRSDAEKLVGEVGLPLDSLDKKPHQFSGGQRQRIAIARALAVNPKVLIADEPVSALDVSVQGQILNLLLDLRERYNLSIIFVSHDLSVINYLCDSVYVMYLGKIVEKGETHEVLANPCHPYTKSLISSIPSLDLSKKGEFISNLISGDLPDPASIPSGCRFQNRCPLVSNICLGSEPDLEFVTPTHEAACILVKSKGGENV